MTEIWKDVPGFENSYEISSYGRLKSKDRKIKNSKNFYIKKGQIIKPIRCTNGYYEYVLHKNGKKKIWLVHRLVATVFIPNPGGLEQVNHKDENISNNNVMNLEWVTPKQNANYGTRNYKCRECNRFAFKAVAQMDFNNNILNCFETIQDGARFVNGDASAISRVCKGKNKTAYGYKWKFI